MSCYDGAQSSQNISRCLGCSECGLYIKYIVPKLWVSGEGHCGRTRSDSCQVENSRGSFLFFHPLRVLCGAYCWYFLFCPFVKIISWAWTQMCCKLIILTWLQKYHMMCAMVDLIASDACCIWLTHSCSSRNMRDDASSFCASLYCQETKVIFSSRWDAVCTLISSVGSALLLSLFFNAYM